LYKPANLSILKAIIEQPAPVTKMGLGVQTGFAFIESSNGFTIGLMAEIGLGGFSITPQANYWKVNEDNNFEMAALIRLKFPMTSVEPYVDGGLGLNFLDQKIDALNRESLTKLGMDLGGGVEFPNVGTNYSIYIDGKYKVIIKDNGNKSGYTLAGGIKFTL
jgi:opacity protein-like surface antigen